MKRVVSISLGSATRDSAVTLTLGGERVHVARIGTNGSLSTFTERLREWDGKADAIGLGGMDRYLFAADGRRYEFRGVRRLIEANVRRTPVVDGSVVKDSLECRAVAHLTERGLADFAHRTTLLVCGADRFGLSESIAACGGPVLWGDLPFTMGIPYVIRSAKRHARLSHWLLPIATLLPVSVFYPTGQEQTRITPRWGRLYKEADIIAGDFHLIRRYLPDADSDALADTILLTNTTTESDVRELSKRNVARLITTTPRFTTDDGEERTFGTNVIEAILTAIQGASVSPDDALRFADAFGWTPDVRNISHVSETPPVVL